MSKSYIVTSFKGGVGKTTLSANLAMSLARRGHKVVAVDCDLESRCLDIVLGLENSTLFNLCDCIKGTCPIDNAIVQDERCENLYFISAPAFYPERHEIGTAADSFTAEAIEKFVKSLTDRFDYVIFDFDSVKNLGEILEIELTDNSKDVNDIFEFVKKYNLTKKDVTYEGIQMLMKKSKNI